MLYIYSTEKYCTGSQFWQVIKGHFKVKWGQRTDRVDNN